MVKFAMTTQERMFRLIEARIYGWRILYVQNILMIIITLFFVPQVVLLLLFLWETANIIGGILNLLFTFAILLDLLAISLICIGTGAIYYSKEKSSQWTIITIVTGIIWVGMSLLWRMNLYRNNPYNIGFAIRSFNVLLNYDLINVISNDIYAIIFLFSSLMFIAFLYSNDMLLVPKESELRIKISRVNLGSF